MVGCGEGGLMANSCPFLANIQAQERLTGARYDDDISETFSGGADPATTPTAPD
jgi:hypothetical protein